MGVVKSPAAPAVVKGDAPAVAMGPGPPAALDQPGKAEPDVGGNVAVHAEQFAHDGDCNAPRRSGKSLHGVDRRPAGPEAKKKNRGRDCPRLESPAESGERGPKEPR